jgi:hypothetical protein
MLFLTALQARHYALPQFFCSTHFSGGFYVCPQFARSFFDALMRRAAD